MSRRIFLHSGSFNAASNIFTKVVWRKDVAAIYRKAFDLKEKSNQLFYSLAVYHTAVFDPSKARGSEKFLVFTAELNKGNARNSGITSTFTYEIESSRIVKTEQILDDEINIFEVKARWVSQKGSLEMPAGMTNTLVLTIKPGLSVTILAEQEIYLSFNRSEVAETF